MWTRALTTIALSVWASVSAASCPLPPGGATAIDETVSLTNALRRSARRFPVQKVPALTAAAQDHACWMARTGRFDHTGARGSGPGDRVLAQGYGWSFVAENIALGQDTAQATVDSWEASPPHRRNMLDWDAAEIGIGLARGGGRLYWVMVLAAPRG